MTPGVDILAVAKKHAPEVVWLALADALDENAALRARVEQAEKALAEIGNDWRTDKGIELLAGAMRGEVVVTTVDCERLQGRLLNIQEQARAAIKEELE